MSKSSNKVFHEFEVDSNLINDLIYSQNGTIASALCELITNALDAKSPSIDIKANTKGFSIIDQGEGFEDEESIMRYFKRFGSPHTAGDAKYGRFRIGRGQIMAFAKTTWHSKNFQMTTDHSNGRAGFQFKKDAPHINGCVVSGIWKNPIDSHRLHYALCDVASLAQYVSVPITINGERINSEDELVWDYEDDDLKILFNPRGLTGINVYSQGIYVTDLPLSRYGINAEIVTKKALVLNMARNSLNDEDPLAIKIYEILRAEVKKRNLNAKRLSEFARCALIDQVKSGEISVLEVINSPILKDIRGKATSIYKEIRKHRPWVSCEPDQHRIGDMIATSEKALVIGRDELSFWRANDLDDLLEFIREDLLESLYSTSNVDDDEKINQYLTWAGRVEIAPFDEIAAGVSGTHVTLPNDKLSEIETIQKDALQAALNHLTKMLRKQQGEYLGPRKLVIGTGSPEAWTDSRTFVAINQKALPNMDKGDAGMMYLVALMLHELTHQEGSILNNGHDLEFYEAFHESVMRSPTQTPALCSTLDTLKECYGNRLLRNGFPPPKTRPWHWGAFVEISLTDKAPTKLLLWLLKTLKLSFTKEPYKIKFSIWNMQSALMLSRLDKAIEPFSKELGIPVHPLYELCDQPLTEELLAQYAPNRIKLMTEALSKSRIKASVEATFVLAMLPILDQLRSTKRCVFGGLSHLCAEPEFGIRYLEKYEPSATTTLTNAERSYRYESTDLKVGINRSELDLLEGDVEERMRYYRDVLVDIILGIDSKEDRKLFIKRFIKENPYNLDALISD